MSGEKRTPKLICNNMIIACFFVFLYNLDCNISRLIMFGRMSLLLLAPVENAANLSIGLDG